MSIENAIPRMNGKYCNNFITNKIIIYQVCVEWKQNAI